VIWVGARPGERTKRERAIESLEREREREKEYEVLEVERKGLY